MNLFSHLTRFSDFVRPRDNYYFLEKIDENSNLDLIRSNNRKKSNFSYFEFNSFDANKITLFFDDVINAGNSKMEKCSSSNFLLEIKQKHRQRLRGKSILNYRIFILDIE